MHVVILPSWFRLKSNITNGSFFMEQAVAVKKAGCEVTVIDAHLVPTKTFFLKERTFGVRHFVEDGIDVYIHQTSTLFARFNAKRNLSEYKRKAEKILIRVIKNKKVDLLHAHSFFPAGIVACELGKKYGIPVVLTEHSTTFIKDWLRMPGVYDYVKPTFDNVKSVCVTDYFCDLLYEKYGLEKRPLMIGNVLSPVFKYSAPVKNDTFTFAMCARLMEKKRVNHVVSAVSILKERGIDVKVNIIGDGPMGEALKAQAKELSVDDRIVFHGNVSREEVYRLVCESDALVHASVVETFGVVYIEAFAAGRPVVSAKNGGACELINDENGILCEPDDPTALADAMLKMINNHFRFDNKNISDIIISKYSEDSIGKQYLELYNSL